MAILVVDDYNDRYPISPDSSHYLTTSVNYPEAGQADNCVCKLKNESIAFNLPYVPFSYCRYISSQSKVRFLS